MIRATVVFSLLALVLSPPTQAAIIDLTAQTSGVIDLTTNLGTGRLVTAQIGGKFIVTPSTTGLATGTGVFDPFVRIERKNNEHGYNTSNRNPGLYFDEKTDPNWTRELHLAEIPLVTIDGVKYRAFNLDVNEPDATKKSTLSLNQIQIFVGPVDPTTYSSITPSLPADPKKTYEPTVPPVIGFSSLTEVFRMNNSSSAFNQIKLDYDLVSSGSGRDDMTLLVENSVFGFGNPNVVVYSHFGKPPGTYPSEAGFEEWAVDTNGGGPNDPPGPGPNPVPEPASLAIWGLGLISIATVGRNRLIPALKSGACRFF